MIPSDATTVTSLGRELGLAEWSVSDVVDEVLRTDSLGICALDDGLDVIGFVLGRLIPSSGTESQLDAEIFNIGVATNWQRNGIASKLLRRFLEFSADHQVEVVRLEVQKDQQHSYSLLSNI